MRGSRVQAVASELGNERLDIVIWDDDPAELLINAMGQVEIDSIVFDEDKQVMEVAVTKDTLAQAIGRSGQNVRLCSQLTGWKINVIDKDLTNDEGGAQGISALVEYLDVDQDLATVLFNEGYTTLDLVSSSNNEDLAKIEGLDEEISELLITRSKEALLTLAMEISSETDDETEDLISLEGVNMDLALELKQKGIKTRNDLAEQSVNELTELVDMDEKKAGELIMKAREHWFNEE